MLPAGLAGHLRAGRLAAGERRGLHARIVDHARHLPASRSAASEKRPAGKPARRITSSISSAHCGTLEACLSSPTLPAISAGRGEAEHLPERKIPRHHRQHRPDGLVADEAAPAAGIHRLVGQQPLAVLRVVAAAGGAFGRFGARGRRWVLPISSVMMRPRRSFSASRISAAAASQRRAVRERGSPIALVRSPGPRQLLFQLFVVERFERSQRDSAGGVGRGDHARSSSVAPVGPCGDCRRAERRR